MQPWWTDHQAAWIGGIGGSVIGGLGGLLGTVGGICAPRGKCKTLVLGMNYFVLALGWSLLIAGVVALAIRQPYAVWYPLLLGGGILAVVDTALTPLFHIRYREAENRRLQAEQLRRG